ncbi:hypothetical protein BCR36DRAFT_412511 [Piromyces finnis]|uniref:polynucleotide adenylyltransferase n=1 Tax=Piromyces finnis TaxID=1754191 RepID=A0A1Y1V8W1_9FUNG|nr:hypothetical protein BCR36DRAFT_412511 [Piromyces finnis]|eukprot:ORX50017.1 hypothetical protein BCR36DRAFT_412511 [Piromyces finnis]
MASKVGGKFKKRKQVDDLLNNKKNIEKKYGSTKTNGSEKSSKNKKRKLSNSSNNSNNYTILYENGNSNKRKRKNSNNDDFIPLKSKKQKEPKIDYRKKKLHKKAREQKRKEKERQKREIYENDLSNDIDLYELDNDFLLRNENNNNKSNKSKKNKNNNGSGPLWAPFKRYSGTFEERLHEEILDFVKYITPNTSEINTRLYTIDKLREKLHHRFPDSKIECFGSFSTGLFLPTSDLDIVVYRPGGDKNSASYAANPTQGNQSKNLNKIARHIRSNGFFINKVIRHSRIPIIKAEDDLTHYSIDISYNQESGVPAIKYIKQNIKKYPALKPLVYILKHFLYINDMNEVFTGGLGSFSVVCLVLSFLKFYTKIFYEKEEGDCELPENLGTLLINFLYLFGGGFDYENIGISVNDGTFYKKMDKGFYNFKQRSLLSLEDPIMPGNDLTKGSHRILEISRAWKHALDLLRRGEEKDINKIKKNQPSLLAKILYFDNEEIRRRKQIREYIYPKVIQRTGNKYSTTPESSENEEEDSQMDNDELNSNENSASSNNDSQASIHNSKKRKLDELDDDEKEDEEEEEEDDDDDDDDDISVPSDKDDDEYIPVDSEEDDDDDDDANSDELTNPPLNDDDEIYEYVSDNDEENSDINDDEYDEYITKQEDDEVDEEFDKELYDKLGETFLDEDNINIDDILYK